MDEMEPYAILMIIFSGALMLYAACLYISGDHHMIVRNYAVKMKNKKIYARQMGKVIGLVALAPLLGGLTSLVAGGIYPVLVMIVSFIIFIRLGIHGLLRFAAAPAIMAAAAEIGLWRAKNR